MNRPEITTERIDEIKRLIADNPNITRTHLSLRLCEVWGWQSPSGQPKDISCRDMLRALDKAGTITLPASKTPSRQSGRTYPVKHLDHNVTPIECELPRLLPLDVEIVSGAGALEEFKSWIDQYHYLAWDRTIGENMKYIIRSREGAPLACLLFGSAAWSCKDRDQWIGWDKQKRVRGLPFLTNNSRFLVLPGVRVPYLASHILSRVARRISLDWAAKYGHVLYALETFVETSRFRGVCYRAANWIHVGATVGRGRDGGHHHQTVPVKDIYLYPLHKNFRQKFMEGKP
jgi:hypothetical protein